MLFVFISYLCRSRPRRSGESRGESFHVPCQVASQRATLSRSGGAAIGDGGAQSVVAANGARRREGPFGPTRQTGGGEDRVAAAAAAAAAVSCRAITRIREQTDDVAESPFVAVAVAVARADRQSVRKSESPRRSNHDPRFERDFAERRDRRTRRRETE